MPSGIKTVKYKADGGETSTAQLFNGHWYVPAGTTSSSYTIIELWIWDYANNLAHTTIFYWLEPGHIKFVRPMEDSLYQVHSTTPRMDVCQSSETFIIHGVNQSYSVTPTSDQMLVIKIMDQRKY